jgi:hypothetical protein
MLILTDAAWEIASYHRHDLMAEAEGERLVAMLPERRGWSLRQGLAHACYRLARWLDAPGARLGQPECAEDWAAPVARA